MIKKTQILHLAVNLVLFGLTPAYADDSIAAKSEAVLHIDIPIKFEKANVVFNVDHVAMAKDWPIVLDHIKILATDFKNLDAKGNIIAIFHTSAGYLVLDDKAYDASQHVKTGNPYKQFLVDLMKQGIQLELCGATAKGNHWVNADLIPGVKINTDAMGRLTQLGLEGYIQITE